MIEKLSSDWNNINSVILYGSGAKSVGIKKIFDDINIKIDYMLDSNPKKHNLLWFGIPIKSYDNVKDIIKGKKIIITSGHTAYNQISEYLNKIGLKEFEDYCSFACFFREWFWNCKHMNCIYSVTMTITTKCTLKCKKCNMFIPCYENQEIVDFQTLKQNIDLLFERIDYVAYFILIGGEPFLSPYLLDILKYLETNYSNKYGKILTTTNGTIKLKDDVLYEISKMNIMIDVSDYTNFVPYKEKFDEVISSLDKYKIPYNIKYSMQWVDFGFPEYQFKFTPEELQEHLQCCRPEWSAINDGKFYFCNVAWSAEKSGNFKLKLSDYITLKDINPNDKEQCHKIVELSRGTSSFCNICGGCGSDNKNFIPVGEQA